ncbi:MAG: metallophosphoesterase [Clostridia bacterium]|nr:metallophosphoesterase [Clostridia bacterium]
MRYYVMADIHGFCTLMQKALKGAGYYEDNGPKKLIICGDLMDRGKEALKVQQFVLDHMHAGDIILVRGNHEDLAMELLNGWDMCSYAEHHHITNGTLDTALQLTHTPSTSVMMTDLDGVRDAFERTPYVQEIIPSMLDYYETKDYIFVHGWIPCYAIQMSKYSRMYLPRENWKHASRKEWYEARWINGMEACHAGVRENKTIFCGHYHCSYGHAMYEGVGEELGKDAVFTPYYDTGIVAIDACTAYSGIVNCVVVEQ